MNEHDFEITLKEHPEVPPFRCVICEKQIIDSSWMEPCPEKPPICAGCSRHWGSSMRPSGVTRGDYKTLMRLKAVTSRLQWEIHNGQRPKRSLTAW